MPIIPCLSPGALLLAHCLEPLGGAVAAVGLPLGDQALGVLLVERQPVRLKVRPVVAADLGPLVPAEPQPAESIEEVGQRVGDVAGAVGILDAQDKLAAGVAGEDVVEQGDISSTDVGIPGGAGGHADAHFLFFGHSFLPRPL